MVHLQHFQLHFTFYFQNLELKIGDSNFTQFYTPYKVKDGITLLNNNFIFVHYFIFTSE